MSPSYLSIDIDCEIDIAEDLGTPQPLLIRPGSSEFFHPHDRSGKLVLEKNHQMELFCSNGFSSPVGIETNLVSITCAYGSRFHLNTRMYSLNEFVCRKYPHYIVDLRRPSKCYNGSLLVNVGFEVEKRFLKVMTICHNPSTEQTYYSKYRLTPANVAAQQGFKRPKFSQGEFFPGKDINFLYSRNQQREAILEIVRSEKLAHKLIQEKGNIFLARGEAEKQEKYMKNVDK